MMNAKGSRDRRSGTRRRGATTGHGDDAAPGRKLAAAALLRLHLRKRNGFGDEDAAPRSKIDAPRGSAAATRVAAPDLNLELCYHVTVEERK